MNTRLVIIDKPLDYQAPDSNTRQAQGSEGRVFGWDAYELQKNYTLQELLALQDRLRADPAHKNPAHTAGQSIQPWGNGAHSKRMFRALSDAIGMKGQGAMNAAKKLEAA